MYKGHVGPAVGGIYGLCKLLSSRVPCNAIIDLGARHGEGFELFGAQTNCATYVMVEPSPRCIPVINDLIANCDRAIELIPGILGPSPGSVELIMFDADNDQSANVFSNRSGQYGSTVTANVPVFSYDHGLLAGRYFDIAKVNIEGGEYQLVDNGYFMPDRIGSFVMEAHNVHVPGRTYRDVISALESQYDIVSYGDLSYKYCFLVGVKL